jgi:hypothetical protein
MNAFLIGSFDREQFDVWKTDPGIRTVTAMPI